MVRESIPAVFREQVSKLRSRPMVYSKRDRHWRPLTWHQIDRRVRDTAGGLCVLGLEPGERIALLSGSSVEWVIADLASLSAGCVDVAISETACADDIIWILRDSGSRAVFVGDASLLKIVQKASADLPKLEFVILLHGVPKPDLPDGDLKYVPLLELEKEGREANVEEEVNRRVDDLRSDDLMTLIYTSGTTGQPKGVMISHGNMISNCEACGRAIPIHTDDVVLSFLPLSHSFERMAGYYLPALFNGATIYYAQGIDRLMSDLQEVKPTLMTGVPRVFEKIYARVRLMWQQADPIRRALMVGAMAVGSRMSRQTQRGREPSSLLAWQYGLVRDRLLAPLHNRLGGRIRLFVSGGAPLEPEIAEFFFSAGILVLEGYGLTEASPVVSVNRADAFRFGTVGRPLDNVRVRLDADGEILIKGPNVMKGYWESPQETKAVLESSGWLATGDIGVLERDGYLRITDRKKDLFKDSGGRYIAPQRLEGLLRLDPYIEEAVVIGDGRPCCVALIVPSREALKGWCADEGIHMDEHNDWLNNRQIESLFEKRITKVNSRLARHEAIRAFHLVDEPFSTENTMLTPTLKIRRTAIAEQYVAEVDALYASLSVSRAHPENPEQLVDTVAHGGRR